MFGSEKRAAARQARIEKQQEQERRAEKWCVARAWSYPNATARALAWQGIFRMQDAGRTWTEIQAMMVEAMRYSR